MALWSPGAIFELALSISIVCFTTLFTKTFQALKFFVSASLPFLVPLLLIHGLLNAQFQVNAEIWSLPYRSEGLKFAVLIYCKLAILMAVAAAWSQVRRDDLFEWLVARHIPLFLLGTIAQSIAMIALIEKRGRSVFKAQTARGIRTGPDFAHRLKAFPSVILPVVTSLINEADKRGTALWSRGFLVYQFSSRHIPFAARNELVWVIAPLVLPIAIQLAI